MSKEPMELRDAIARLPSVPSVIAAFQLSARKALGQHFLLDSSITDDIALCAGDLKAFNIIEIGPGPGSLTRSLLRANAGKLFVIEKDERCLRALDQIKEVAGNRLEILLEDALEVDLVEQIPAPRKIVANLPYNVGTALLIHWLGAVYEQGSGAFASMTLMFQKEVAERIIAEPNCKDFGRLSVLCQWLCECRYDFELPPEAFSPPPKVSSAVVTLIPRPKPLVEVPKDVLETVVAKAFGQRRKMLRSSLKGLAVQSELLLDTAKIDGSLRAEQLSVEQLCHLASTYRQLL